MKNSIITSVIFLTSFVFVSTANALEVESSYCDPVTGDIGAVIEASYFDSVYHDDVIISVRDNNSSNWKVLTFNLVSPKATYDANSYQMGLTNSPVFYNIATSRTTLVVAPCE